MTTSKTNQVCETSFQNGKLSAELTASYQSVLRFFHSTCLKYCTCHEKVMPGHTKCCTCHALQNATHLRKSAPALMNMSLVLLLPRKMHLCRSSSNVPRLPSLMLQNLHVLLTFSRVQNPLCCHAKRHFNVQKWHEHVVFCILTSKRASHHNGVHFFDI